MHKQHNVHDKKLRQFLRRRFNWLTLHWTCGLWRQIILQSAAYLALCNYLLAKFRRPRHLHIKLWLQAEKYLLEIGRRTTVRLSRKAFSSFWHLVLLGRRTVPHHKQNFDSPPWPVLPIRLSSQSFDTSSWMLEHHINCSQWKRTLESLLVQSWSR